MNIVLFEINNVNHDWLQLKIKKPDNFFKYWNCKKKIAEILYTTSLKLM